MIVDEQKNTSRGNRGKAGTVILEFYIFKVNKVIKKF